MTAPVLIRESDQPTVYRIAGGGKFVTPSPNELFALGFTWADVVVVPPGGNIRAEVTFQQDHPIAFAALDDSCRGGYQLLNVQAQTSSAFQAIL